MALEGVDGASCSCCFCFGVDEFTGADGDVGINTGGFDNDCVAVNAGVAGVVSDASIVGGRAAGVAGGDEEATGIAVVGITGGRAAGVGIAGKAGVAGTGVADVLKSKSCSGLFKNDFTDGNGTDNSRGASINKQSFSK